MQTQIDFTAKLRDEGIQTAIDHAGLDWSEKAYEVFKEWLSGWPTGYAFMFEGFRFSAEARGLETPPSKRAYGAIAVRAKKDGLIQCSGYGKTTDSSSHKTPAAVWRRI